MLEYYYYCILLLTGSVPLTDACFNCARNDLKILRQSTFVLGTLDKSNNKLILEGHHFKIGTMQVRDRK